MLKEHTPQSRLIKVDELAKTDLAVGIAKRENIPN